MRKQAPPTRPALRTNFLKHESLFFGVTPSETQQEEAFEANRRAFYGVEAVGREEEWNENVKRFFGVEEIEAVKKRPYFEPQSTSIPAGKLIPRDPAWKPADSHSASVMFPPAVLPNSAVSVPAGKEVPRDLPWKPEDEYRPEDMFPRRRKAEPVKRLGNVPAGKLIEKDPIWRLSEERNLNSYKKNMLFAAFNPSLRDPIKSADRTAGKRIPRDPVLTLAALPSRSQNRSALAKYGAETIESHSFVRASLDSKRRDSRAITPELSFAGVPSQRELLDHSGHNPILNPIGAQLPGPLYRRPSRR